MTEPTGILDRLGRMASDLQTRCEEYHAQLDDLNTCRCSEDITALDDARAAILQYRAERDAWLQQHAQDTVRFTRERDALVEALRTKIEEWRGRVEHEDAIYRANPYGLGGSYGRPIEECIDDIEDILAAALPDEEARDD